MSSPGAYIFSFGPLLNLARNLGEPGGGLPLEDRVTPVCSSWEGGGSRLPPWRLINGLSRWLGQGCRQSPAWISAQKGLLAFQGFLG